jgi:asparagine synthase (glutamine-hydrolysing)
MAVLILANRDRKNDQCADLIRHCCGPCSWDPAAFLFVSRVHSGECSPSGVVMGAIVGLVGEGSLHEVRAMAQMLSHRGAGIRTWSPAHNVYFATRGGDGHHGENFAADAQLDELSGAELAHVLEQGVSGLAHVHGYFAIAHYDQAGRVVLACDTSGFKSLYYAVLPTRIAFASEYKAFLALEDFYPELNREAAQHYLAARSCRMDQPLMQGVQVVASGTALLVSRGGITERLKYWPVRREIEPRSVDAYAKEVRTALTRIVERQARPFDRAAITLSGGLDSACVVALLRSVRPDMPLHSYTIGHGDGDPEMTGGRELAELFGTDHHEIIFHPASIAEHLPKLVWLMEDCAGREESLLQHLVVREAARSAPVVFGGYGADMLFCGMPRYRLVRLREQFPWLQLPLSEIFHLTQVGALPKTILGRIGERLLYRDGSFPPPTVNGASTPALSTLPSLNDYIVEQMFEAQDMGYIEPTLEFEGAQFRDPFQATDIMELALKIPGHYNVSMRQQKQVLRTALQNLLPTRVRSRGKSLQRVRHDLEVSQVIESMAEMLLHAEIIRHRNLLDPAYVTALMRRPPHRPYTREQLYRLWTLVCLELWQRQFIDQRVRVPQFEQPQAEPVDSALTSAT